MLGNPRLQFLPGYASNRLPFQRPGSSWPVMLHVLTALSALLVGAYGGVDLQAKSALGKALLKLAKQQQQLDLSIDTTPGSGSQAVDNQGTVGIWNPGACLQDSAMPTQRAYGCLLSGAGLHAPARSGYPPQHPLA